VRRLTDGDSDAGDHFAAYFGNMLFLKLRVRLRSEQLIEDIRQETLLRVLFILRQGRGVKRPEHFGAFVNGVCNYIVRERCRHERDEAWEDNRVDPIDPATENPDAGLINADLQRKIAGILAQLPEKDRKILRAIYLDELDKAEVCRRFKVSADYLRVLIYRAKIQFREAYEGGPSPAAPDPPADPDPPVNPGKE